MTVICGLLGTLLGLGIYQRFGLWIELLASVVPPLIGPVISHYYIVLRGRFDPALLQSLPVWSPAAIIAYVAGAVVAVMNANNLVFDPEKTVPALLGLVVSMLTYVGVYYLARPKAAGNVTAN
jgi:cytosine permease